MELHRGVGLDSAYYSRNTNNSVWFLLIMSHPKLYEATAEPLEGDLSLIRRCILLIDATELSGFLQ